MSKPQHKGDRDTDSVMKRRDAFVVKVADSIDARHGKESESFVFGLSGKWGEGKTHFLQLLRTELESRGFEVLELNPWKYAADRVAFLRSFLIQMLESQSKRSRFCAARHCLSELRLADAVSMIAPRRFLLARLKTDVTRQRISWPRFSALVVAAFFLYWLWLHVLRLSVLLPTNKQGALVGVWGPIVAASLALFIGLVQGLVNSQVSSKAAAAVDDFDRLISLALGGTTEPEQPSEKKGGRKVAVLVDDLDRVTPDVARGVLDNLRTFFDRPAISFVVTGDHSVLEASVGRELAPNDEVDEQLDEGRRFMKKVFNLYWRLPLPVRSDFESFIDRELETRATELQALVARSEDRATLRLWLLNYCEMNLRCVIRTLDMLLFTLGLVQVQHDSTPESERPALKEMLNHPLLLGRVLMIQDRCAPLFELMVEKPSLLLDLDREVATGKSRPSRPDDTDAVRGFLAKLEREGHRPILNPRQGDFLRRFAYEQPLFYDSLRGGQIVRSPGPWIHLAGDLSFQDASGPQPEDFARDLANLNAEAISAGISRCSEAKAEPVAKVAVASLENTADAAERSDRVMLLIRQSASAEPAMPLASALGAAAASSLEKLLEGLEDEPRVTLIVALMDLVDRQTEVKVPAVGTGALAYRGGSQDLHLLPRERYGTLGSSVVADWLNSRYSEDPADCLIEMEELLPHVDVAAVRSQLSAFGERLAADLVTDTDDARRHTRLAILVRHIPDALSAARHAVFENLPQEDMWKWAGREACADDAIAPWVMEDIHSALIDWVVAASDVGQLLERLRYSVGKLNESSASLWNRLDASGPNRLDEAAESLVADETMSPLVIPRDVATRVYAARVHAVASEADEARSVIMAAILDPASWLWSEVEPNAARKSLTPIARRGARRRNLQAAVRPFWETWGMRAGRRGTALRILEATYGAKNQRIDVTRQLNDAIVDGRLHIRVGNEIGGDPCVGTPKDLALRCRLDGQEHSKTVSEGEWLDLP